MSDNGNDDKIRIKDGKFGQWAAWVIALVPMILGAASIVTPQSVPPLTYQTDRPGLVFSEYLMHFGNQPVPQQPEVNATFLFRNVGDQPVNITDMKPSCGCLTPKVSISEIAPGESGRLTVPIKTLTESPGFHEYTVTVKYTDPTPREVTLAVKMTLPEKAIQIEPRSIYVIGQSTQSVEHTVTVSDLRETPLRVEAVSSSTTLFTPRIIERQRDHEGSRTTIGVTIAEKLPRGIQRGIVQVTTTDPVNPVLHVPVMARGPERDPGELVAVQPEHFRIAAVENASVPATVEATFPSTWKLSHLDAFPPELDVEFQTVEVSRDDLQQIRITLSFSELPAARIQDGVVTINANDGRDMITIPISIVWQP